MEGIDVAERVDDGRLERIPIFHRPLPTAGQQTPRPVALLSPYGGNATKALRSRAPLDQERHPATAHGQILAHIDYLDETIAFLSARIEQVIAPFSQERELLETIPGVGRIAAQVLIAEIGVDMNVFPTSAHLASWAGQCPANHESAGKRRPGRPRQGSKWLQTTLNESAKAASRSKGTYLSAKYQRLRGRRGPGKATGALRHSILIAAYHILDQNVPYHELGADYFDQRRSLEQRTKRLVRQLQQLGHTVTLEPLAA